MKQLIFVILLFSILCAEAGKNVPGIDRIEYSLLFNTGSEYNNPETVFRIGVALGSMWFFTPSFGVGIDKGFSIVTLPENNELYAVLSVKKFRSSPKLPGIFFQWSASMGFYNIGSNKGEQYYTNTPTAVKPRLLFEIGRRLHFRQTAVVDFSFYIGAHLGVFYEAIAPLPTIGFRVRTSSLYNKCSKPEKSL
ncbi:MAG: hypothetical protein PVI26_11805 [Chitinispirillia bacterium]|jgi:hypothetical protein